MCVLCVAKYYARTDIANMSRYSVMLRYMYSYIYPNVRYSVTHHTVYHYHTICLIAFLPNNSGSMHNFWWKKCVQVQVQDVQGKA
jgi:hypothetical protein